MIRGLDALLASATINLGTDAERDVRTELDFRCKGLFHRAIADHR